MRIRESVESRNEVIRELHHDQGLRKLVIGTLIKKGCAEGKAKDLYTDAIINFTKACTKPDFAVTNFPSYMTGIARNLFFRWVTNKKSDAPLEENTSLEAEDSPEIVLIRQERKDALRQLLSKLDDICLKVLTLWSQKTKMTAIAQQMNYKSEGMARKKKHQCLQRLYKIVDENPGLKDDLRSML